MALARSEVDDPVTMFPPKDKPKTKGADRMTIAFRVPDDLLPLFEELKRKGYGNTEIALRLIRLGRDVEAAVGADLAALERAARIEDVELGAAIGRLAVAGLAAEEKKGRR